MSMKKIGLLVLAILLSFSIMTGSVGAEAEAAVAAPTRVKSIAKGAVTTNSITVKWSNAKRASGYQVYRTIGNGKFKRVKVAGKTTRVWKNTKLKANTTYKYKVRAYKIYKSKGKKRHKYGKFSKIITIKTMPNKTSPVNATTGNNATVAVSSVTLNKTSTTLMVGYSETLKATVSPTDAAVKTVTWSSSDKTVASVSSGGRVTARKKGTATITAKSNNGKTAKCVVTVEPKKVVATSLKLEADKTSLARGESCEVRATLIPQNAEDTDIVWYDYGDGENMVIIQPTGRYTANATCVANGYYGSFSVGAKIKGGTRYQYVTFDIVEDPNAERYLDASSVYANLNTWRTNSANQWYWNSDNTTKTYTGSLCSLQKDKTLENVAKLRAKEAWNTCFIKGWQGTQNHYRPDGTYGSTALWEFGLPKSGKYGEDISFDSSIATVIPRLAEEDQLYSGQGHRRDLLTSYYTKVGIAGYSKYDFNSKTYHTVWCVIPGKY